MLLGRVVEGAAELDVRRSIIIVAVVGGVDIIFILSTDGTLVQKRNETTVSLALGSRIVQREFGHKR